MRDDPILQAEAVQDAVERFGEVGECLQYGDSWSCTMPATPDGPARLMGHDDRANEVWTRRFRCVAGHWYDVETSAPHCEEANSRDAGATPRVSVSASHWWE